MSHRSTGQPDRPHRYEIRLQGQLDSRWAARFDGMTLTTTGDATTVIEGPVVDQAALHGFGRPRVALPRQPRRDSPARLPADATPCEIGRDNGPPGAVSAPCVRVSSGAGAHLLRRRDGDEALCPS